ncbi:hypothetical protein PAMC26577_17835 [Caballeronia sordidicola]|uniref:Uncharacterized protein n=1 Tax=Caballeronia sordidicola TaxID=196367 RepID=A0A242MRZ8_CABSO|nr:hypothetical protein PAMC26577_17835 [Caballeronia sordidicola]
MQLQIRWDAWRRALRLFSDAAASAAALSACLRNSLDAR